MKATAATVAYSVPDPFPADPTIRAIGDALSGKRCTALDSDPFNPDPAVSLNRWTEYRPDDGGAATRQWTGAWTCAPEGDLVAFGLTTRRDEARGTWSAADVNGMFLGAAQLRAIQSQTAGGALPLSSLFSTGAGTSSRTSYQTCSVCRSTQKRVDDAPWRVLYDAPASSPHDHAWRDGVASSTEPIRRQVVLVRRQARLDAPAYIYGAFILDVQRAVAVEGIDYQWVLRTDGSGELDPANTSVMRGSATNRNRVEFGPFRIPWSAQGAGSGYLYYPRFAGAGRSSDDWNCA